MSTILRNLKIAMLPDAARGASKFRTWGPLAALAGLVLAVYWPVGGYEFVNWDDPWYVLKNPLIRTWEPSNLWQIATETSVKNYAPLTTLSLLVDHTLFGLNAAGYHRMNVALHIVNVLLVCLLVSRVTGQRSVGLITAALFAVHPVQIETVAWVSSRKTLLCSACMLASGLCWLRPVRTGKHEFWGTGFLGLALLAKAAAIVMPPMVVAYDLLLARKRLSESIPRQILPTFLCVLLLNITMSAQNLYMGGVRGHMELSKLHLLGVDSIILWRYVGMLIAPLNLSLLYDPPTTGIATAVVLSLAGWSAVGVLCWRWRKTRPGFVFAVLCWFWLLAPVLNLFPITTLMNDRYLYLPCLCVFVGIASGGAMLISRGVVQQRHEAAVSTGAGRLKSGVVLLTVTGMVSGFALASRQRLPVWRNDFDLWSHTVQQVPQLAVVQIQWSDALRANGQDEAAAAALRLALLKCEPDEADRQRILDRLESWAQNPSGGPTSFVSVESAPDVSERTQDAR